MIRVFIGFILGVVATFYALPVIESGIGKIDRPAIGDWLSSDDSQESSKHSTYRPTAGFIQHADTQLAAELVTAISSIRTRAMHAPASEYVVKLITKLVEREPGIQPFVSDRIGDGLTNQEALEIFEQYYSIKV